MPFTRDVVHQISSQVGVSLRLVAALALRGTATSEEVDAAEDQLAAWLGGQDYYVDVKRGVLTMMALAPVVPMAVLVQSTCSVLDCAAQVTPEPVPAPPDIPLIPQVEPPASSPEYPAAILPSGGEPVADTTSAAPDTTVDPGVMGFPAAIPARDGGVITLPGVEPPAPAPADPVVDAGAGA